MKGNAARLWLTSCLVLIVLVVANRPVTTTPITSVVLSAQAHGLRYDGIAALTQGGQQRLLIDYPEPQRQRILDLLFCSPFVAAAPGYCTTGQFGAAFHALKVEIGGDGNEAEGAEPSHAHTESENSGPCHYRGYSWWLMHQAKMRNPQITFSALPWGVPGWVGGIGGTSQERTRLYSTQGVNYVVRYLQCAKLAGLPISVVGVLNEDGSGSAPQLLYAQTLKSAIASATNPTLENTKLACCEFGWEPFRARMDIPERGGQNDVALRNAVDILAVHYPDFELDPNVGAFILQFGKANWATEEAASIEAYNDGTTRLIGEWLEAQRLADILIANYYQTAIMRHDIIFYLNGFYDTLYAPGAGLISADQPWSGHFDIQPGLWTIAHFAQFAQPGWYHIGAQGSGCFDPADCGRESPHGTSPVGQGMYMSVTDGTQYSIFAHTRAATAPRTVTFTATGGLTTSQVRVYKSDANGQLIRQPDPAMSAGQFTVTFEPGAIYTISSLPARTKLDAGSVPSQTRFPATFADNFDGYVIGDNNPASGARSIPRYISALEGSFDLGTAAQCAGSPCLIQAAPYESRRQFGTPGQEPYAMFGDRSWTDYQVTARVAFAPGAAPTAAASVQGRFQDSVNEAADFQRHGSYEFRALRNGQWFFGRHWVQADLTYHNQYIGGSVPDLGSGWHTLRMRFDDDYISLYIDNLTTPVATYRDELPSALAYGMAGIGSGWNLAGFDDVAVEPINNSHNEVDDRVTGSGLRQFNYAGTWIPCPCPPGDLNYANTITSSNSGNDTMTFRFSGTRVVLFGTRARNGGYAEVSILGADGVTVVQAERRANFFHEARTVGDQVVFVSDKLPAGTYTVKVRVAGAGVAGQTPVGAPGTNYVHLDRITVVP